jgi:hypothetical protein
MAQIALPRLLVSFAITTLLIFELGSGSTLLQSAYLSRYKDIDKVMNVLERYYSRTLKNGRITVTVTLTSERRSRSRLIKCV